MTDLFRIGIFKWLMAIAALWVFTTSQAAVERIVDYEYDAAGNIVRIVTREQFDPPTVSALDPVFINIGRTVTVTAAGTNLLGVDVLTDVTGLSIGSVSSTSTGVSFELTASAQAQIGPAIIRFVTGLGEVQQSIAVAEEGPGLKSDPHPIAIDDGGALTSITLTFSEPRPGNETYTVSVDDTAIANATTSSFTILSGESQVNLSLAGIAEGATNLQIIEPGKFFSYSFAVFVGRNYEELITEFPEMQARNLFTAPVGVVIQDNNPYLPNTVTSGPVGVLVDSNAAFYSRPVGVFVGEGLAGGFLSKPVGVLVSSEVSYAYTPPIGTVYGPLLDSSQPAAASPGSSVDFDVNGFNLDEVLTVTVTPADDVTVGTVTVNPEGTLLTVSISIDPLAVTGTRELMLNDASGPVQTRSGTQLTFDIQ